jgi:uncharacterized protein (TIGR02118 family)
MVKLTVLYGPPTDPAAFDDHYFSTHVPLASKIPDVRRMEVARMSAVGGGASPYHLIAELYFDSADALDAALATPEGQAAAGDVANFATGGATMLVGEVHGAEA